MGVPGLHSPRLLNEPHSTAAVVVPTILADRFVDDGIQMETAPLVLTSRRHFDGTEVDLHNLPHDPHGFPRLDERGENGRPTKLTGHVVVFSAWGASGGGFLRSWFC